LTLLCAIRYGACDLGYRVVSDTEVAILHRREKRAWDGFPYDGYPAKLPPEPIDITEEVYDPANLRDALSYAEVFGSLRPFAIFREERGRIRTPWGPNCGSLQIIDLVCPACGAIRTGNQCD
jgi:hypothetical protein